MKISKILLSVLISILAASSLVAQEGSSPYKVEILDDEVSAEHFSKDFDVRVVRAPKVNAELPKKEILKKFFEEAKIEKDIEDYDFLMRDKLYFYLGKLEVEELVPRFPEISERKLRKLKKLRTEYP